VGHGSQTLWNDLVRMPALLGAFVAIVPLNLWRFVRDVVLSFENPNPGG